MCPAPPPSDSRPPSQQQRTAPPLLSVIVPTLDEEALLGSLLADLRELSLPAEVIVADGGSSDATTEIAARGGARVLIAPRGRGPQLGAAAAVATGAWLLALHADARLDADARRAVERTVKAGEYAAYALRLRILAPGVGYRLVELAANVRSRWRRLPYGDQGLLLPRALYDAAGGFPPYPLMEDVALIRAVGTLAPVRLLDAAVGVSARRWARDGVLRRSLRNWRLLRAFNRGTHPAQLAARYDAPASRPDRRASPRRGAPPGRSR